MVLGSQFAPPACSGSQPKYMSHMPYDRAFKYLAEQDAESLLILLGCLRPGQPAEIDLLPREIDVSMLMPDQPYRVVIGGDSVDRAC